MKLAELSKEELAGVLVAEALPILSDLPKDLKVNTATVDHTHSGLTRVSADIALPNGDSITVTLWKRAGT